MNARNVLAKRICVQTRISLFVGPGRWFLFVDEIKPAQALLQRINDEILENAIALVTACAAIESDGPLSGRRLCFRLGFACLRPRRPIDIESRLIAARQDRPQVVFR